MRNRPNLDITIADRELPTGPKIRRRRAAKFACIRTASKSCVSAPARSRERRWRSVKMTEEFCGKPTMEEREGKERNRHIYCNWLCFARALWLIAIWSHVMHFRNRFFYAFHLIFSSKSQKAESCLTWQRSKAWRT